MRRNLKLCDMNLVVEAADERSIEVLACGLPLQHGAQLAVDITLQSALTSAGIACPNAAITNGAVLHRARQDKEAKCWELLEGGRCHLIVVALETGGSWGDEAIAFIDSLASARSRAAVPVLRGSAYWAWRKRWVRMLAITCARAFASSLISSSPADMWTRTARLPTWLTCLVSHEFWV